MENKLNKRQELILNFLNRNGKSSTSKIAMAVFNSTNSWSILRDLEDLRERKLVIKEETPSATYWSTGENSFRSNSLRPVEGRGADSSDYCPCNSNDKTNLFSCTSSNSNQCCKHKENKNGKRK